MIDEETFIYLHLQHAKDWTDMCVDINSFSLNWDAPSDTRRRYESLQHLEYAKKTYPHMKAFIRSVARKYGRFREYFQSQEKLFQRKILTDE